MKSKDWLMIFCLGGLWGSSFFFVELLLEMLSPFLIVYLRVALAAILLLFILLVKQVKVTLNASLIFNLFIMAMLNNVLPFLLIAYGQQTVTGGLASILNANTSLLTILIAPLLIPSEKLSFNRVGGAIIGVCGVIVAVGYENIFQIYENNLGKYLILLATLSYAIASVWAKLRLDGVPALISATGMLTGSAIILTPFAFFYNFDELANLSLSAFSMSALFAILCSVLAYIIYFKILESAGASNLLVCTVIIPPSAILLNLLFLNQAVSQSEMIGLLIIVVGLIILDGRYIKSSEQL
ncbi:DMT family transporter [Gammaproteobacteria bacterium]|jgi:drug/metabolite transporter (DMT)-like permease|nr:DMT family transporter [Gammaproteobacteria bacterium]